MSPAEPIVVAVDGVTHRYGKVTALADVSLSVRAGTATVLVGPDGVGKSSLFALVAGARAIQSGRIEVLGGDMARASFRARVCPRIAYMPQGLGKNLYMSLSVFENVDYFARLFGQGRAERARRIAELLEATGLAPFAERAAGKLSGGMKQKLGLCCALIHDPDLLILDEPTTGVDPLSRRQFWELIERIRAARPGMSVLIATAYMEEAARFDWLAAMNEGRVLATGAPGELLALAGARTLEEAFIGLLPQAQNGRGKRLRIARRNDDPADLVLDELRAAADVGHDRGHAIGHGLDHRLRQPFAPQRRKHGDVARGRDGGSVFPHPEHVDALAVGMGRDDLVERRMAHVADEHGSEWQSGAGSEVPGEVRQIWPDITRKEALTLVPLALLTIYIGVYPQVVLDLCEPALQRILEMVVP